jgi:hypothetical protein
MPCDIFDKLVGEDGMSAVDKFHGPFEEGRYVYPILSSNHFTLSVLDLSKSRSRFATIDSLSWHEDYIRNAWEIFFKKRNLPKLSIATLDGGRQLQNDSECGAFTLLNMDALVKEAPFFDIKSWNQEALARNCLPGGTCQVARERYASLLRHQCLQWFRDKIAVHLHSNVYIPPKCQSFVQLDDDDALAAAIDLVPAAAGTKKCSDERKKGGRQQRKDKLDSAVSSDAAAASTNQTAPIVPLTAASEKEGSSPETKVTSHTAFWAESKDINVASYLSTRFNEKFEEHANVRGNLCQTTSHGDDSNSWTKARFFVSSNFVAKVYRILWNPDQPNAKTIFPQALHESAATAFVCRLQKWHCEVFGVFHQGTNAVYLDICLIRTRLNPGYLDPELVATECIRLLKSCGVMHGDGHIGNAKFRLDGTAVEIFDFERSFLIGSNDEADMVDIIQQYARNPDLHTVLLQRMEIIGMNATRNRFTHFVREHITDIFNITLEEIVAVFQR